MKGKHFGIIQKLWYKLKGDENDLCGTKQVENGTFHVWLIFFKMAKGNEIYGLIEKTTNFIYVNTMQYILHISGQQ